MALIDRFVGPDDIDARRLSLGEHLDELRRHVLKSVLYFSVATILCLCFQSQLMLWATWPHRSIMKELKFEANYRSALLQGLPSALVTEIQATQAATDTLEADTRALERDGTILKELLDKDPQAKVRAIAARERDMATKVAALAAEQQAALKSRDAAQALVLETKRKALTVEVEAFAREVREGLGTLNEHGEIHVKADLSAIRYTESVMAYLKVAMVCALFVSSPLIARELWKFVSAGLYKNEKRYVTLFAPATFFTFIIGASFGYFLLIPAGLKFLAAYGDDYIQSQFTLSDYLSLFLTLTLAVGLIFELPLVMMFVSLIGFISPERYASFRRYWVLVAFILAAAISPTPDPFNQTLCAVPLIILYEIGIWLSRWVVARRDRAAAPGSSSSAAPLV